MLERVQNSRTARNRIVLIAGAILFLGGALPGVADTVQFPWTTGTGASQASGNRFWSGIASSADGSKLVACANPGRIYTSPDSGSTWTARAFEQAWVDVASSANGATLVATWDMDLYVSTDSGVTWVKKLIDWNGWGKVACSADGTVIAVCTTRDYSAGYLLHVSTDGGGTFAYCNAQKLPYSDVAMSADGTKIVACVGGGQVWTSADTGAAWTAHEDIRDWRSVASSADGTKLAACVWGGQIYTSGDSGATWTAHEDNRNWRSVASSADGTKLAAHALYGDVYFSTDAGAAWTPCGHTWNFKQLTLSADGTKLFAGAWAGPIHTFNTDGATAVCTVAGPESQSSSEAGSTVEPQREGEDVRRVPDNEEQRRDAPPRTPRPDGGYLTNWLVAGPLDEQAPFDALFTPAGGAFPAPREGETLNGFEQRWVRYRADGDLINLREVAGYDPTVTAAAYCEFDSDADQRGHIYCASQNTLQLWVNGRPVFDQPEAPYSPLKWEDRGVDLLRGVNSCLIVCSACNAELFGFALRVEGPEATPATPLVWNPSIPSAPSVEDGRYVLLSPDWRWMAGDDPAWAQPGYDDSNWNKVPDWPSADTMPPGGVYWMRVLGCFAYGSTLAPYGFVGIDAQSVDVYLDGARIPDRNRHDWALEPFRYRDTTTCLPRECTLAVRVVSEGCGRPIARLAVQHADKAMNEELRVLQPRKQHRLFLLFLLAVSVVYYLLVYRNHPRQIEGTVCCVTVALAIFSMLIATEDSWTFKNVLSTAAWMSPLWAGVAFIAGIAMVHVMAYGAVSWRAVLGYGVVSAALFASGWKLETRWIAFSIFPLMTLEYLRVWTMYDLIPRRANRGAVGLGLFFLVAAQIVTALYGVSIGQYFPNAGPYAHLYGLVGLAACLVMYTSRESALGMHELLGLTATLESKVAERTRQVQQLTQQVVLAEGAERAKLSRELHDSVAQALWFAKLSAEKQFPGTPGDQPHEIVELLDKAIEEVRGIAYGLHPPELAKLGLVRALMQLCKYFSYVTGISVDYQAHGMDNVSLSPVGEVNVYRVLQEALNNVRQHAEASNVRVRLLGAFPKVILRIEDDGRGFAMDQEHGKKEGHMGLRSMEERMRLLGGTMRVNSAPGEGMRIVVEIPQQKEQA